LEDAVDLQLVAVGALAVRGVLITTTPDLHSKSVSFPDPDTMTV
jgi:hypothetical protein